jgi:hypothetical protein
MTYSILVSSKALQTFMELLAGIAVALAFAGPRWGSGWFRRWEGFFSRLSRRRRPGFLVAALFPLTVRVLLLPVLPFPAPRIHDEFSYLLLGDTLAHGRLANPTPPLPEHFETEYELMRPTYASQYQPGQGLFLAAGQAVAGHPWWGVWLSVGLMCGSLYWALAALMPDRWALFGAFAAALQFGIYGFWMNGYFGGAVTAVGGALVFGSLARRRHAALCALGLIILFATRPVEAVLWTGAAIVFSRRTRLSVKPAAAFLLVLASGAGALSYYNFRVTGDAFLLPYAAYRRAYGVPQSFWWQPAVTVAHFPNKELAENYRDQFQHWQQRYSTGALWNSTWRRARDFWRFFIGPFLTPALLFAGLLFRRRKLRPWLWLSALFIADHATYHAWYPQQSGSETVLIVLLLVECWRMLRAWHRRQGYGVAATRFLIAGFAGAILAVSVGPAEMKTIWVSLVPDRNPREAVIQRLDGVPGRHLVFVHYGPGHRWYDEWVFNGADIPNARIVFARMCGPEADRALTRVMADRDVWVADPDLKSLTRAGP